jgi:hypothetical protein
MSWSDDIRDAEANARAHCFAAELECDRLDKLRDAREHFLGIAALAALVGAGTTSWMPIAEDEGVFALRARRLAQALYLECGRPVPDLSEDIAKAREAAVMKVLAKDGADRLDAVIEDQLKR